MSNETKVVCLFHGDCFDGMGAAWAVSQHFPNAQFIPVTYGDPVPAAIDGSDVIMVDFCYPYDTMVDILKRVNGLTILDHHDSAQQTVERLFQEYPGRVKGRFSQNHSGAALAWYFYNGGGVIPSLILHIEDRDLHRFAFNGTREFTERLGNLPLELDAWKREFDHLLTSSTIEEHAFAEAYIVENYISDGKLLLQRKQIEIERVIAQTLRFHEFFGHKQIPLINVPRSIGSDALTVLATKYPFAVGYYDTATHRVFSIRGHKDCGLKLNDLAETLGGGGHPLACGFRVERDHPLAQI